MSSRSAAHHLQFQRLTIGGMDVLLAPRRGRGLVAATALARRGSVDEAATEHGLASFTIAMLMRGTARRSSERLAFDLESLGAIAGEDDGADACSLSMRSAEAEATAAIGILFEALREPAFDATEHEIHRQEVLAHLRMIEDEKFAFTYRRYLKVMFAGHGYGHPAEGEMADVEAIAPEDCRRWHAEAIRPETILLVVAGDFDPEAWKDRIAGLTADWPVAARSRPRQESSPQNQRQPLTEMTRPALQQGFVIVGFATPPVTHADYPALRLASAALGEGFGGRIFANLRDRKSLAYACGAALHSYRLGGHQTLHIGTKPQTIGEGRDGLLEEANYLKTNLLGDEELNRAREFAIGKHLMGRQSFAQRVAGLAWWEDHAGDAALDARWPDRLREVTAGQILEAARRWWNEPTVVILRPE